MSEIALYEELSMNARPAIKTYLYDGWILRFANGYTNRLNSVNMIYPSKINPFEKIKFCENFYASLNLASIFKLTPLSIDSFDMALENKGYKKTAPLNVMVAPLTIRDMSDNRTIITSTINSTWQENHFLLNGVSNKLNIETERIIQSNTQNKVLYASIAENGTATASGFCVIEREYAGLFDIAVDSKQRGKGLGLDICTSLLNAAAKEGVKHAYLQVVADNIPAIALYGKLGFEDCYQYWYRVKDNMAAI